MRRPVVTVTLAFLIVVGLHAQGPARGGAGRGAPPTPQAMAPATLTGYWVAVITEDWRWRMITPAKGDYASIPLTVAGLKLADTWDPSKDEAAGEQCRSYGAPGLMRAPTRLLVSWLDPGTLKVESDYGMQTRLFHFGNGTPAGGPATWQGASVAEWITGGGRGGARGAPTMKAVTTHLRPGYLRKNGVPYSANALYREYWDVVTETNGDQWLVITNVVVDPANLQTPFTTALNFKKEPNGAKWDPTPCSARW